MKTICLYFEIHQIMHLKRYRFFDVGADHYYYNDYANDVTLTDMVQRSYMPALQTLLQLCENNNKQFKVAFSISGVTLEQLEIYASEVIVILQKLNKTGSVEFIAEPYSHGLSSLANEKCFVEEVKRQSKKIKELFGKKPTILRNSSLLYSDEIGEMVNKMGFKAVLTEGAKQILGWKSPHYLYHCATAPKLKLLLRDYKLSDDICLRFNNNSWSEFPLTASKYTDWLSSLPEGENVINIFMELQAIGVMQPLDSNILEFFKALPQEAAQRGIRFATPSEIVKENDSVAPLEVPYPLTWNDEERDTSSWLGNDLQREAFNKLYSVAERVYMCNDRRIKMDWDYLQGSANFRFMNTKSSAENMNRGIYESAYDAFTNYMNIIADFTKRVDALYPEGIENDELNALLTTIRNQDDEIKILETKLGNALAALEHFNQPEDKEAAKKDAAVAKNEMETKEKKVATKKNKKTASKKSKKKGSVVENKKAKPTD